MKPLNLFEIPLKGTHLIEASAGTGKTYTIASLYVRLLLETTLQVREILVVTYTEAATGELRGRIRERVRAALKCFVSGQGNDPFLLGLVERTADPGQAVRRLEHALRRFDEASIFTIHGFCQRVLSELAFESRVLFDHELITDQAELLYETVGDFCRMHFTDAMPRELAHYAMNKGHTFGFFLGLIRQASLDVRIIPDIPEPGLGTLLGAYRESFGRVRSLWKDTSKEVEHLLLNDPGLNRSRYRASGVLRLMNDMEEYASSDGIVLPLFKDFEKLTAPKIESAAKKGFAPLRHDFFTLCHEHGRLCNGLTEGMERWLVWLKVQLFRHVRSSLPAKKDALGVVYFDDLLLKVRDSLASESGPILKENLSERYRAALIDEFQDTDPVQYEIFHTVFSGAPLFLIGDPKQAIYSFRGADIFTYLNAASEVGQDGVYTLEKNWRSEPELVRAVNSLFDRQGSFVFDEIRFAPVAPGENPLRKVLRDPGPGPLTIWYADNGSPAGLTRPAAEELISRAVAAEISRLLRAGVRGEAVLGQSGLAPRDVAVIVRENSQGRLVRDALTVCGIPCVLSSEENVFDTPEALEMEFLLRAVAQPYAEPYVRTALAGPLFGLDASEVDMLGRDDRLLETWVERFRHYHDLWAQAGFMRMFRKLTADEGASARILGLTRGERTLTNFLHLAEVLNQASMEHRPGMRGLIKWLSQRRDPSMPRTQEHQLRLESDEDAVKVITVHKSKGLEFPIVFCPFLWGPSRLRDRANVAFHDPGQGLRAFFDLGSDQLAEHRDQAERELMAEDMRLVYVALTRAKNRCYLVWGRFYKGESSALSQLFPGAAGGSGGRPSEQERGTDTRPGGAPDIGSGREQIGDPVREELMRVCRDRKGCILVEDLPREAPKRFVRPSLDPAQLSCREFTGRIDRSWRVSSFSSMVSDIPRGTYAPHDADVADRDALYRLPGRDNEGEGADAGSAFRLPGGARTGIMLHSVFERLHFQAHEPEVRALVAGALELHGFKSDWEETVTAMVKNALVIEINGAPLAGVPNGMTLRELEFYLPVRKLSKRILADIFRGRGRDAVPPGFPDMLEELRLDETRGFLRGFIDLVFASGGRYYLLDWKSNRLGPRIEHYGQESMEDAMVKNYYILQYHLYTAALHAYLEKRLKGYSYQKHMGGVVYVFLRGLDPAMGPEYGVYRAMPEWEVIRDLSARLAP